LSGIWWILVTGCQWNQLPERYGKWNSVYRFHNRWAKRGVFQRMIEQTVRAAEADEFKIIDATHIKVHQDACHFSQSAEQQGFGKTKGGRNSKLSAVTNSKGKLVNLKLVPGNESDMKSATEVLGEVEGLVVLADRGYDSNAIRQYVFDNGGFPNIPGRSNRKIQPFYLKEVGKRRHVVENFFGRIKRFRRVCTRYDRLAETYLSFVFLAALMDWLR
jgi:transposase